MMKGIQHPVIENGTQDTHGKHHLDEKFNFRNESTKVPLKKKN